MCQVGSLWITPWHPVFDTNSNKWVFPCSLVEPQFVDMPYVYSLVLDNSTYAYIEGVKCVSMAHNITQFDDSNIVLKHPYYGTSAVITDLEMFKLSDDSKMVLLDEYVFERDDNQMISRILKLI